MENLKKQINEVYETKGLNGVHNFLKKHKIPYSQKIEEFGLHTRKGSETEKKAWLTEYVGPDTFRFHLFSLGITSKGYMYNILRGKQIKLHT